MGPHRVGPLWPWLVVLSLVVPLVACSPECEKAPETAAEKAPETAPGPAAADDVMIHISHNKLDPAEVSVSVGDTLTFHNLVEMPGGHTIVADDGSFESPALEKDATWAHVFEKAGSYAYHIKQHPDAKGVVVVE